MTLCGVDVSHWNTGVNLSTIDIDFAIFKLTQGTSFVDNQATAFLGQCKRAGIMFGCYHFANKGGNPVAEAEFFYSKMREFGIIGEALPVLDYEVSNANDRAWCEQFMQRFFDLAKIWPVLYVSASWCKKFNASWIVSKCPLWVAGYPKKYTSWPASGNYPYDVAPWQSAIIWQFTGSIKFRGVTGSVDGDFCYIDRAEWANLAKGSFSAPVENKALSKIADEVIGGKWGNGKERVIALERAGYDAKEVQRLVNEKLAPKTKSVDELAREVIAGKWGNGSARKNSLTGAGYDYAAVQKRVNEILRS